MLRSIVHRGPDEEGTLVVPRFAAGTRRLSIIDLEGGHQPIWNESETLAVFFNGEIYNFRELRDELHALGHTFRTSSDTEVIVHAYEAWGPAGFERLHGMFAFALAEMPNGAAGPVKRVILARDRFGIKPLYYAVADGGLFFSSEVRSLLASGCIPAQLCSETITSYLLFGSVGEPQTLVEGVWSLPSGHYAEIEVGSRVDGLRATPYWSVDSVAQAEDGGSGSTSRGGDVAVRVRAALESAVRSHLVADVPVGVFLSSGLDSTAIAALAARAQRDIHTFTVGFPDLEFSEAAQARQTAQQLGTQHSELQLSGDEMLARLDEAIAGFDQPSMDGINTYFVSWAARQSGLKVALSGLGSDEIFGGYPTFRTTASVARLATLAHLFPPVLRQAAAPAARMLKGSSAQTPVFEKAVAAWLAPDALPHPYFYTRALFDPRAVAALVSATKSWQQAPWWQWLARAAAETKSMDSFSAVSWLELRFYMLNTLLRDTDTMSMHHSLEVRVPFLDPPLVQLLLSLPESQKRGASPKALLIAALGDLLPADIIRGRKRTFTFPWEKWLRGPLRSRVTAGLADWSSALAPVVSRDFALRVWDNFERGRTTWSRPWSLYVLNEWAKRHLCAESAVTSRTAAAAGAVSTM